MSDLIETLTTFGAVLTEESGPGIVHLGLAPEQYQRVKTWFGTKFTGELQAVGITFIFTEFHKEERQDETR